MMECNGVQVELCGRGMDAQIDFEWDESGVAIIYEVRLLKSAGNIWVRKDITDLLDAEQLALLASQVEQFYEFILAA